MVFQQLPSVAALEQIGQVALSFSAPAFGLSESQKQHIQYAGAASVINIFGGDIYDTVRQGYAYLGLADGPTFKEAVQAQAPSFAKLLDQFVADNLFAVSLTSVGQAIAIANISSYFGKLDYTIWLK